MAGAWAAGKSSLTLTLRAGTLSRRSSTTLLAPLPVYQHMTELQLVCMPWCGTPGTQMRY